MPVLMRWLTIKQSSMRGITKAEEVHSLITTAELNVLLCLSYV